MQPLLIISVLLSLNLVACGHKSDDAAKEQSAAQTPSPVVDQQPAQKQKPEAPIKTQAQIYQEYWSQFVFKYNGCDSRSYGRSFNFMISDDIDFHLIDNNSAFTYKTFIINLHEDGSFEAYLQTFEASSINIKATVTDTKVLTGKSLLDKDGNLHLSNIGTLTPKLGDIFVKLQIVDNFFDESLKGQTLKIGQRLDYENPGFPELTCKL